MCALGAQKAGGIFFCARTSALQEGNVIPTLYDVILDEGSLHHPIGFIGFQL